jgi:hypothetical protein
VHKARYKERDSYERNKIWQLEARRGLWAERKDVWPNFGPLILLIQHPKYEIVRNFRIKYPCRCRSRQLAICAVYLTDRMPQTHPVIKTIIPENNWIFSPPYDLDP